MSTPNDNKRQQLISKLKELFQLDQPDLDFGLYRIMHAKSAEISQFLEKDLLAQVQAAFALYKTADKAEIEKELAKVIAGIEAAGMDPSQSPKVKELQAKLQSEAVDVGGLEGEVYDHLLSFFRRYYSEGDFLSRRVYKSGVYAIPYEGEEVKLHWANADQYYIKTSEFLRDYTFRLRPGSETQPLRVHFRLVDATEDRQGNAKVDEGDDRVFILAGGTDDSIRPFLSVENGEQGGELAVFFEYRPATVEDWPTEIRSGKHKPPTQRDLLTLAIDRIFASSQLSLAEWIKELRAPHVTSSGGKTESSKLEVNLKRFAARNTFDYFIHKDLDAFLRRELDFYIKNEVMHLDDVESETAPRVEQYLSKIKVIRTIASKIITFLAQLENFQKKLWLKKKFVIETHWCVALSAIPEDFYPDIARNDSQRDEWIELLAIEEIQGDLTVAGYSNALTPEFLKSHPTLAIDTRHFEPNFVERLLESLGDIDQNTDGLLVHSENFQALTLMEARYRGEIKCIYIDPPYNTDAGPIDYKNGYRSSSWMSMIQDRLSVSRRFLSDDGVLCATIDDYQVHELAGLLDQEFGRENQLGTAVIRINPSGRPSVRGLSVAHEYAFFYTNGDSSLERLPRSEKQLERFSEEEDGYVNWQPFRKGGGAVTYRSKRPKQYYPIYVRKADRTLRIPALSWNAASKSWDVKDQPADDEIVVWPTDEKGNQRIWSFNHLSALKNLHDLEVRIDKDGLPQVHRRHRPTDGVLPRSWWDKNTYAAREHGSAALVQLFGTAAFSFAKSPFAVQDSLWVSGLASESEGRVLDYFAGSGTTGHAAINLNREDGGRRKFILVETGDYFNTVLLPRIKKITFAPEWKDGKPKRLASPEEADRSPRIIKVVRLESYDDTLNNLESRRTTTQQTILESPQSQGSGGLREEYMLRYLLDVETRASQALLNVQAFSDPTAYKLRVRQPGSDSIREASIDLVETFNWLTGLTVDSMAAPRTFSAKFVRDAEGRLRLDGRLKQDPTGAYWFRTISGTTPDGRLALIVWRKLTSNPEEDNLVLDEWFTRQGYSSKDSEFDLIYVNGGNNLENLKAPDDTWKVRLIEEDFHRLMFATEGS